MEESGNSLEISKTAAVDKENAMQSSLHQYYQDVMDNTKHSSIKVERATKFLLLPEISKLVGDHTKAMFLLSKGLTHDEVSEAFKYYYRKQKETFVPSAPELALHNVSQTESTPLNVIQRRHVNDSPSGLSLFFNLCQRVMVLAGISTAFYYLYQNWFSDKTKENKTKKEHKRIEEELNQIKSELQKITAELKIQQMTGKTNANLAAEINSLKAILVSRQHFEELQSKKVSIPSWQLNKTNTSNIEDKNAIKDTTTVNGETPESTPSPSNSAEVIQETSHDSVKTEIAEKTTLNNICQNGNQSSAEFEEKIVKNADSDQVSDSNSTHKTRKSNSKNKNSKSKVSENGKNTLKQNGVVRENLIE